MQDLNGRTGESFRRATPEVRLVGDAGEADAVRETLGPVARAILAGLPSFGRQSVSSQ
jgi:hypothetical protein